MRAAKFILRILSAAMIALPVFAAPTLPHILSDHMVLQRDRPVHIWGWARPGEKITVRLAGKTATATTSANKQWSVHLPALSAGGPYTLTVAGDTTIRLKDILIGEVWVASGQSNMTYGLNGATGGPEEVAHADYPQLRLFTVPRQLSITPKHDTLPASWAICSPESAKEFSAVAYFFARDLHRKLGVPVGIIETAWPGTPVEEWIAPEQYSGDADLESVVAKWKHEPVAVQSYAEKGKAVQLEFKDFALLAADGSATPVAMRDFYHASQAPALYWNYDWLNAPRTQFEILREGATGLARVSGPLDQSQQSLANAYWNSDRAPRDLSAYDGIRFQVRGDGSFRMRFLEPTITDWDDYASSFRPVTAEWQTVTILFKDLHQEGWGVVHELTTNASTGITIESVTSLGYPDRPPSGLYHAMIEPLVGLPVRGAIWYQGESNALQATLYRKELPALIRGWRKGWRDQDFPFLVVELPNHGATASQPGSDSWWAQLRDAQFHTMATVPNVGLAVTIDVGDPNNVHPPRKAEVGERLALWALGTTYHQGIEYSGPIFSSAKVETGGITLRFTHAEGLHTSDGGALKGFSIAGADGHFYWANAEIRGDSVLVSNPNVPNPVEVRYAWDDSPLCNFTNRSGIPASPFRSVAAAR